MISRDHEPRPDRRLQNATPSKAEVVLPLLAKGAAELLPVPGFATGVGAAADFLKEHLTRTREAMRSDAEQRLSSFYAEMFQSDSGMDEQVARVMVDDKDFHALLRACVEDIEAEKVGAYVNLARGIARGSISRKWRRHFILCLRDLCADELECLRGALVALKHELRPAHGGGSVGQEHFLEAASPGTPQAIRLSNLVARALVHDGKLSEVGAAFAEACFDARSLTPSSLGFGTWSGQNVAILSYELGSLNLQEPFGVLQDGLRNAGIKSNVLSLINADPMPRMVHTVGILLVRRRSRALNENLEHLIQFAQKVPTALVDLGGNAGEFPDLRLFARVDAASMTTTSVVEAIRRLVIQAAGA